MGGPSDNPIADKDDDRLGRAAVAEVIAGEIRGLDASEGCVVGILGPWGPGRHLSSTWCGMSFRSSQPSQCWISTRGCSRVRTSYSKSFSWRSVRSSEIEPTDFGIADDLEAYGEMVAPLRLLPVVGVWVERARP